uniref:Fatty-acid amide hydrolase 1 n=1 Tax=Periophthalmus magnuspinnatus TaxID=409849 RepID=A0A3B4ATT7_9GOBI
PMETLRQLVQTESRLHTVTEVALVACLFGGLVLVRTVRSRRREKRLIAKLQNQRERSLQQAEQRVMKYKQHPVTNSAFILNLSLSELTNQLQEGSLSPEEVFYAYMDKTLDVQQKLNCCTEIILDSFEQLKAIDSGKKGLLYGVPVSLKENIFLKVHASSCGVVRFVHQPADDDCVLVKVLKKQGAIPFVRTNVPQSLLNYDCSNQFYGQTLNPCNLQKTPGGSSGGEASLIAGGGSVIGLGSDIGGSVRIPASFCGICGLKPTSGRLSSRGLKSIYRGQKAVLSSIGPLGKDVDSLALFMRAILCDDMYSLDPTVPPLPFKEEVYRSRKPLRIGYFEQIEETPASPSMIRAVQEVKALLEQAGHTLVPYSPVKVEMNELAIKGAISDGGGTYVQQLKGSRIDPTLRAQFLIYRIPNWLKKIIAFIIKPLVNFNCISLIGKKKQQTFYLLFRSVAGLWKLHASIEDTIAEWQRLNIDVVLCPIIGPAFNFNYCGKLTCMASFSMIYNVLNFCAGVVPVSIVTAQDEKNLCHLAAKGGEGLPVAVQCVALPWQDELCLRFMKEVEELVKKQRINER